jgi:hypothetical protein
MDDTTKNFGSLEIHFHGDITKNHQVSLRTLGKALKHTQNAIDRAYIDEKRGGLTKNATMHSKDYPDSEFLVQPPEPGGYIIRFFAQTSAGRRCLDKVSHVISKIYSNDMKGATGEGSIQNQAKLRLATLEAGGISARFYDDAKDEDDPFVKRDYAERSIAKEIDQLLSIIRSKSAGDSQIELTMIASSSHDFMFGAIKSDQFHAQVSRRSVGQPIVYEGKIVELNAKLLKGQFENKSSEKSCNLVFPDKESFESAKDYLEANMAKPITFIGAPIVEFESYDIKAGDVVFLKALLHD